MTSSKTPMFYNELAKNLAIDEALNTIEVSESEKTGLARFSESQIEQIMDRLDQEIGLSNYLVDHTSIISPTSISLYVLNEALWKIMGRRKSQSDKMLAMCTIPLCTWEKETASNPSGVKRWDIEPSTVSVMPQPIPQLGIKGQGGNFCGFIEQSMKTSRHFGIPGSKELVPNYQFSRITIDIDIAKIRAETNPLPDLRIDYNFSESAKVFFDHGIILSGDGESFNLAIDKRKPLRLNGDVLLFIGRRDNEEEKLQGVLVDIWFQLLQQLVENSN